MFKKLFRNWFKSGLIRELNETIKALIETNNKLEDKLKKEQEKNRINQNNLAIILENNTETRKKIEDLENNIEFLVNNLSKQKRELIRGE